MVRCAIWYHLYNFEDVENTHGGVLLLQLQSATLLKVALLHGCISHFLNCTNGTKLRKASQCQLNLNKIEKIKIVRKRNFITRESGGGYALLIGDNNM